MRGDNLSPSSARAVLSAKVLTVASSRDEVGASFVDVSDSERSRPNSSVFVSINSVRPGSDLWIVAVTPGVVSVTSDLVLLIGEDGSVVVSVTSDLVLLNGEDGSVVVSVTSDLVLLIGEDGSVVVSYDDARVWDRYSVLVSPVVSISERIIDGDKN